MWLRNCLLVSSLSVVAVAISLSLRDRRSVFGPAVGHRLSDPFDTFERSSKELDRRPNLCSNIAVGMPGSPTPLATGIRPGAVWGSASPGRPQLNGEPDDEYSRADSPGSVAVQGSPFGAGAARVGPAGPR